MKVFISWSGGKDCMLALNRVLNESNYQVCYLLNMCSADGLHSGSHGLKKDIIEQQAEQLSIPIIQKPVNEKGYESSFKDAISKLKEEGIKAGVFGDIYLQPHRDWIERVCKEMEIEPIFPLWGENTKELLDEFISNGFKSVVVSVNSKFLTQDWLGKQLNNDFIKDLQKMPDIDACAENGEYHSFVFDGPIFKKPTEFMFENVVFKENHWLLPLTLQ